MNCTISKSGLVEYDEKANQVTCHIPLEVMDVLGVVEGEGHTQFHGIIAHNIKVCYAISMDGLALRLLNGEKSNRWQFYNTDIYDIGYTKRGPNGLIGKSKILLKKEYPLPAFEDGMVGALFAFYRGTLP